MLCFYHDPCADGYTCRTLFARKFPGTYFVRWSYSNPPDILALSKNEVVYMLDCSVTRETFYKLIKIVKKLVIIDHHQSCWVELGDLAAMKESGVEEIDSLDSQDLQKFDFIFDQKRSGAGLVWDYCFGQNMMLPEEYSYFGQRSKILADYVEDRDLWKWQLLNSQEINEFIATVPKTEEGYSGLIDLLNEDFDHVVGIGFSLRRQTESIVTRLMKNKTQLLVGGETYWAVNSLVYQSEVGNELAKQHGLGCVFGHLPDRKMLVSFRSIGDIDVSVIAKRLGGGGHKNAASAVIEIGEIKI